MDIADLICGTPLTDATYEPDLPGLVSRLRSDIVALDEVLLARTKPESTLPEWLVLPFLLRKFLELATTAVLSRGDPLRVLSARKNQLHASYELGKQNPSSISWTGDIFSRDKAAAGDVWESSKLKNGPERSLLGMHFGDAAISPGLVWLADQDCPSSMWVSNLSKEREPISWLRGRLATLYSTLSKGVHAESLTDSRMTFDNVTIMEHQHDVYMLSSILAVASHASPLFMRSIEPAAALKILLMLEQRTVESTGQK